MARVTYHLVDLRGDGYRGGYLDTDARILIACFKLFEEFYEKEYPGPVEWDRKVAREIEALHGWWKRGRRQAQKRAETLARQGMLRGAKITKEPGSGVWKWNSNWRSAAPSAALCDFQSLHSQTIRAQFSSNTLVHRTVIVALFGQVVERKVERCADDVRLVRAWELTRHENFAATLWTEAVTSRP